jgi:Tfp pilus assembly protein PilV
MSRASLLAPDRQHIALKSQRGVSLVEAIVAMAVMAFGMMAIVGLQSTLRLNSDVSKQRSEAVRIAEEAIEDWRAFSTIPTRPDVKAYDDIPLGALDDKAVPGTNANYTLKRTVEPGEGWKSVQVEVSWVDRTGQLHTVTLSSVIAGVDPSLSGVLSTVPAAMPVLPPLARTPDGSPAAVDLGGGKSAYRPPGAPQATVWVFDNLSGVITSVCNFPGEDLSLLVPADNCFEQPSWLISGFVRFSFGPNPNATDPADEQIDLRMFAIAVGVEFANGDCFVTPVQDPKLTYTSYVCRVPQSADTTWTGKILLGPPPALDPPPDPPVPQLDLALHDICRYSNGAAGNINHPRVYTGLDRSLGNQNFLVVDQNVICPAGTRRLQPPEVLPPP